MENELNKYTIEELKEQISKLEQEQNKKDFEVGENYLIRTVTHINVGKLIKVTEKEFYLQDCSWVADTGRFANILKNGLESEDSSEIEPFGEGIVIVGRGALIDMIKYNHKLPDKQK